MLVMLAKQELVGHSGDVIAHHDVASFCAGGLFVGCGHGTGRIEVVEKKLFEAADRAVAVFSDGGVIIDVLEEKALHFRVALGKGLAETGQPAWGASNVVHGSGSGSEYALLCGIDEIGDQVIEHEPERGVEFEFVPTGGIGGIDLRVSFGENWNFISQRVEIEELCFARVVQVRGVIGNFVDPNDELALERRAKIEQIFGEMREFHGSVVVRVLDDAFADFKSEIQAGEIEVGTFELFDNTKGLEVVVETQ